MHGAAYFIECNFYQRNLSMARWVRSGNLSGYTKWYLFSNGSLKRVRYHSKYKSKLYYKANDRPWQRQLPVQHRKIVVTSIVSIFNLFVARWFFATQLY